MSVMSPITVATSQFLQPALALLKVCETVVNADTGTRSQTYSWLWEWPRPVVRQLLVYSLIWLWRLQPYVIVTCRVAALRHLSEDLAGRPPHTRETLIIIITEFFSREEIVNLQANSIVQAYYCNGLLRISKLCSARAHTEFLLARFRTELAKYIFKVIAFFGYFYRYLYFTEDNLPS